MFNKKLLASILLVLGVMFAQVGNVAAAPQTQDGTTTTLNGTIQEITTELDANGETVVIVKLVDEQGTTQTVTLSAQEAADNGLLDPATSELLAQQGDSVELVVDPNDVVPEEEPTDEYVHPIAKILATFFGEDASVINAYHEDGFGFGVIAQALWMSRNLTGTEDETGDASLAEDILLAKRDKDYDAFFIAHPEYADQFDTTPTNWGQFKKVLREKKQNLGVIVSEQEENGTQDPTLLQQDNKDNGKKNRDKHNNGKHNNNKNKP